MFDQTPLVDFDPELALAAFNLEAAVYDNIDMLRQVKLTAYDLKESADLLLEDMEKVFQPVTLEGFIREELGYPLETYTYTTADGCVNSVMRIPGPKGSR